MKQLAQREVDKYFWNFLFCLVLYVPLGLLIWMFPYVKSTQPLLTVGQFWRGNTVYVLLCLIFATIVQFIMGQPFYLSAYKSLKHGNANMDVLIVVSTTCAWLYGVILFFVGYAETYTMEGHNRALSSEEMLKHYRHEIHANVHNFETSAILILIVLLGKYIESYSKLKTLDKISVLASLKVSKANLLAEQDVKLVSLNSAFTEIAVELLAIDDFIVVQPGGAVPTDGQVVLGSGICNESMLTGEARPVTKEIGMSVFGGTILSKGSIVVRVTKLAEDATFNQIMKMVENAQNSRAPIQTFADQLSGVFVPTIVVLAILTWIVWFSLVYSSEIDTGDETRFQFAFDFGISTLVIACPCALGLATPTAVMVGTGLAASYGILIKSADVLEKIGKISTIVFDKTGTLTAGEPKVVHMIQCKQAFKIEAAMDDEQLLQQVLYLAESSSEHPIAKAICAHILDL